MYWIYVAICVFSWRTKLLYAPLLIEISFVSIAFFLVFEAIFASVPYFRIWVSGLFLIALFMDCCSCFSSTVQRWGGWVCLGSFGHWTSWECHLPGRDFCCFSYSFLPLTKSILVFVSLVWMTDLVCFTFFPLYPRSRNWVCYSYVRACEDSWYVARNSIPSP